MLMILILLAALTANIFKLLTVLPVNVPSMNSFLNLENV